MKRIVQLLRRSRLYNDVLREIREHVREKVEALVNDGVPRDEAERMARREFGNVALVEERSRDAWGWRWAEDFLWDVRFGARQLGRSRLVALAAIATLALGIGANTAIFAALHAVVLQPLPFPDPERLVLIHESLPGSVARTGSPLARVLARAGESALFTDAGAYWNVSGGNGAVFDRAESTARVQFSIVTNSVFRVLGVRPSLGRAFSDSEGAPGGGKVFVASDDLWRGLLGADPNAIGKAFRIDGESYTLIGVLPRGFRFPDRCDLWMPLGALPAKQAQDRLSHQFWMIAHLRAGITLAQANSTLNALQQRWGHTYASTDANWRVTITPLLDDVVGNARTALWVLMMAAGLVLLIACSNVANLLLARAVGREKEFAVRVALGGGRGRLVRQVLAETLVLAGAGTALALGLARLGLTVIATMASSSIPRFDRPEIGGMVLTVAAGLAIVTTVVVGLASALHASRSAFAQSLQAGQRSRTVNPRGRRVRSVLVVVEIGLTVVLLACAGVMLRTVEHLRRVDPGFRADQLVTVKAALPDAAYPRLDQRSAFLQELLRRLNATPGIVGAAAIDRLPLSGDRNWGSFTIIGRQALDPAHAPSVESRTVSARYFETLGIPLLRGRELTEDDVAAGRAVVVINRAMAEAFWPGVDPIGQAIVSPYHPTAPPRRIVGIVGNVRDFSLGEASPPEMYGPIGWWNDVNLVLRTQLDSGAAMAAVRAQVNALDRGVAVYGATPLETMIVRSVARQRFELFLLALFALLALGLAAIGVYGVLAFSVTCRTQEIGTRLALGAAPRRVMTLVLGDGVRLVCSGVAAGLAASLLLTPLMSSLLFQVSPSDPVTLIAVVAILMGVGVAACLLPALRAMRVDPIVALRSE
jgi:predicted permease